MSYALWWNIDVALVLLLPVSWMVAAWRLRRGTAGLALPLALLVLVARAAVVALVAGQFGAVFAQPALVLGLPAAVPPAVAVAILLRRRDQHLVALRIAVDAALAGSLVATAVALFQVYDPQPATAALLLLPVLLVAAGSWLARTGVLVRRHVAALAVVGVTAGAALTGVQLTESLSASRTTGDHGIDAHAGHTPGVAAVSVGDLTGPRSGQPVRRFTLTAQTTTISLPGGSRIDALAYNGQVPGPQLRLREGELVEVELRNADVAAGVSLHWHGIDVPNAEDGVPGVTQDAVRPGGRHLYRFVPPRAGTFWYHSHHVSSEQVARGLFGAVVVEPRTAADPTGQVDLTLPVHRWEAGDTVLTTVGSSDLLERRRVAPGSPVRLRLINTDKESVTMALAGGTARVVATDGNDVNRPTDLRDGTRLPIAAGGRADLGFTMPARPVRIGPADGGPGLLLTPGDPAGVQSPALRAAGAFDRLSYGAPATTPFDATTPAQVRTDQVIDSRLRVYAGGLSFGFTVNGAVFPRGPVITVHTGDLVRVRFVNRSMMEHPMHLHGHRVLVLARNGVAATGSPWWTDTVPVAPGETYDVAFRADNPGIWMNHCHQLDHAANGMTAHVHYDGVSTPYRTAGSTGNEMP